MSLFSRLYTFFSGRRRLLFALTLALLAASAVAMTRIEMTEDIGAMLPDDGSAAATDFALLQQAPFASRIVIVVEGTEPTALPAAADRLAAALPTPLFSRVLTGPEAATRAELLPLLHRSLPSLCDAADRERLAVLDAALVRERLEEGYRQLLSPAGWTMKGALRSDPLQGDRLALAKLKYLNLVPEARLVDGHFASADGRSLLLVAETPIPLTDSRGAEELLAAFEQARTALPAGVTATLISGHRYTLANATAIKGDLATVLTLSSLAVLAIYLVFLRSWQGIFVFLVPGSILLIASGVIALGYREVFAVTLGFGGVLLGIADEYAMHVYFSCRGSDRDRAGILDDVAGPVSCGALATIASFAVLLVSSLPGQRQLAVYAIVGIVAALLLSLVVLPHLVRPAPGGVALRPAFFGGGRRPARGWVLGLWLAVLLISALCASGLRFNGELKAMSLVPAELRQDEQKLQQAFGDIRGKAMLVVEESDLEAALARNEALFQFLRTRLPQSEVVSLAPLLPSAATQERNRRDWQALWQGPAGRGILADLAAEGRRFGFATDAFAPFHARLTATSAPVTVDDLRRAGLGPAVDALLLPRANAIRLLTLAPDSAELRALFAGAEAPPGVHLVSQAQFGATVGAAIERDFSRYLVLTLLVVGLLVIAIFRNLTRILLALVPVVTGLLVMFGVMGLCGIDFNLFNIVATVLIIGLCVDYGIFMVSKVSGENDSTADLSVLVSGLTTLAGFGILVLARHPALHSIGVTVLLGIGAAIPAALYVIPALHRGAQR